VADSWFELKWLAMYSISMYQARDESENGG